MIGTSLGTLCALEELWTNSSSDEELLMAITPHISNILVNTNQVVFLDMMKYVAAVFSSLYEDLSKEHILQFTEKFIQASHLAVEKYYDNHDFNQERYLNCVAALLSMWIDTTSQHKLVWRKIFIYLRGSDAHMLDTILQSSCISKDVIRKILKNIKDLPDVETFVRYVMCGRKCQTTEFQLFALSFKPSDDIFRNWLIKRNVSLVFTPSDFVKTDKFDDLIIDSLADSDYTLPSRAKIKADVQNGADIKSPLPALDLSQLFFIDRGSIDEPAAKRKSSRHSEEVVPTLRKSLSSSNATGNGFLDDSLDDAMKELDKVIKEGATPVDDSCNEMVDPHATKLDDTIVNDNTVVETNEAVTSANSSSLIQTLEKPSSPLKITNQRKRRGRPCKTKTDKVLVIAPKSPVVASLGEESNLTEKLSCLPNSRRRMISESSEISVDSVASRTRSRKKPAIDLDAIKENSPANVKPKRTYRKKAAPKEVSNEEVKDNSSQQKPVTRTRRVRT